MTREPSIAGVLALVISLGGVLAGAAVLHGCGSEAQPRPQAPAVVATSLTQAVEMAEQQTGGRARKAELETEHGGNAYEIKTVAPGKSAKVLVDPASGKVLSVSGPGFLESIANVFDREDQREDEDALRRLQGLPMTLAGAITAAERETGGRAVEATLESRHGATLFEVTLVKDLAQQEVLVDPAAGKVVPKPPQRNGKDEDEDDD
jgi:uncharacterized membrane protein YkoI